MKSSDLLEERLTDNSRLYMEMTGGFLTGLLIAYIGLKIVRLPRIVSNSSIRRKLPDALRQASTDPVEAYTTLRFVFERDEFSEERQRYGNIIGQAKQVVDTQIRREIEQGLETTPIHQTTTLADLSRTYFRVYNIKPTRRHAYGAQGGLLSFVAQEDFRETEREAEHNPIQAYRRARTMIGLYMISGSRFGTTQQRLLELILKIEQRFKPLIKIEIKAKLDDVQMLSSTNLGDYSPTFRTLYQQ